jgi:glycosyltransferase involved in cell wall biosynthesis
MKIFYDYQGFHQRIGGISRYYCEVIKRLRNYDDVEIEIGAPFTPNLYLRETLGIKNSIIRKLPPRITRIMSVPYCKYKVAKNDFDILHATFDTADYFEKVLKKPYVLTFHDLIPEYFLQEDPTWKDLFSIREKILKNASRIICICKYTRDSLLNYYPFIDPNKTDVIYHGITPYNKEYAENTIGKYILYVGGRREYKNFRFCVKALKPLLKRYTELRIICTGYPFINDEGKYLSELGLQKKVINIGYVDDDTLASLYHNALVFIFPSKYEGFGLPLLETFVHECPACIAKASCFPEIAGDSVSYFDPNDKESILSSVTKIIEDEKFANSLRIKGKERAKLFTWENAASKMRQSYMKTLNG